ncbi:hypothetical protein [Streptomyces sp. WAC 00631]|nr:hypothetical protein [Streptomyces sp. WAC 00631]
MHKNRPCRPRAQGEAQTAIDKWKEGVKASEAAADAHRKKVD